MDTDAVKTEVQLPEGRISARTPLDWQKKYETSYCIDIWLRNEQIKLAIARKDIGRIEEYEGKRKEPIAVVGFAPSLQETWEKIREFPYVITCSGAHKFLLEKGVIPTWHVEVDPRPHKVELLGTPHPEVTYLPASTCHPKYFDHLVKHGAKVRMWHVFSNEEDALRTLPRGEWALTGGPDVGLRSMLIARFFGFRQLHVFGMDGCMRNSESHAASHPNAVKVAAPCEYRGKTYYTTPALLECAKAVWHEMDMLKDVKATFYGEGLIQAMMKDYKPNPPKDVAIGINKPEVISSRYRELNEQLHRENLAYGVGGGKHAETVLKLVESLMKECKPFPSVLDYGAGKQYLAKALPFPIWSYDPVFPEIAEPPRAADLVCCLDVLEHIEPEKLPFVLDDLRRCVKRIGYFVIHTGPAAKTLPDGRNTHLIQQNAVWWRNMLGRFFAVGKVIETPPLIHVILARKVGKAKPAKISVRSDVDSRLFQEAMA